MTLWMKVIRETESKDFLVREYLDKDGRVAVIERADGTKWMQLREKEQREYELRKSVSKAIRSYYEQDSIEIQFIECNMQHNP